MGLCDIDGNSVRGRVTMRGVSQCMGEGNSVRERVIVCT